jgi:hypothetical protein
MTRRDQQPSRTELLQKRMLKISEARAWKILTCDRLIQLASEVTFPGSTAVVPGTQVYIFKRDPERF